MHRIAEAIKQLAELEEEKVPIFDVASDANRKARESEAAADALIKENKSFGNLCEAIASAVKDLNPAFEFDPSRTHHILHACVQIVEPHGIKPSLNLCPSTGKFFAGSEAISIPCAVLDYDAQAIANGLTKAFNEARGHIAERRERIRERLEKIRQIKKEFLPVSPASIPVHVDRCA